MHLYLASSSPRRKALLTQLGYTIQTLAINVPEIQLPKEPPKDYAERLALDKAKAGWQSKDRTENLPVLGADTIVVINDMILGKPKDKADALNMLQLLSGKTHTVITAIALVKDQEIKTACNISKVDFRDITQEEAERYWQTGEPADKAGSYGIQEKGALFVKEIHGSYTSIMGLPIYETAELLKDFGITLL